MEKKNQIDFRSMTEETKFMLCPLCRQNALRVKPTKQDNLFISCVGYPMCKNAMNMPKGIVHL